MSEANNRSFSDALDVEETFDGAAPLYDLGGVFRESGRRLVDLLNIAPGANVLDIATGTGAVLLPAARRAGASGHVTGIDISTGMLQRAQRDAMAERLGNITLLRMDGGHLEFDDASFDVVTCGFGIFFLVANAMDEMNRVCKPGGIVGLTVFDKTVVQNESPGKIFWQLEQDFGIQVKYPSPLPSSYTPEEIEILLTSHGFGSIRTVQDARETLSEDLEDYWRVLLSGGNRAAIMSMDAMTRDRFKRELFDRLKSIMKPDGLHVPFSVMYATGSRRGQ